MVFYHGFHPLKQIRDSQQIQAIPVDTSQTSRIQWIPPIKKKPMTESSLFRVDSETSNTPQTRFSVPNYLPLLEDLTYYKKVVKTIYTYT